MDAQEATSLGRGLQLLFALGSDQARLRGGLGVVEIAKLVGVAPLARDSGTMRGKRMVYGGRASVRAALYMGALVATKYNPVIRALYQRLLRAGKAKKLALVACMRKLLTILNAMAKNNERWRADTTLTTA